MRRSWGDLSSDTSDDSLSSDTTSESSTTTTDTDLDQPELKRQKRNSSSDKEAKLASEMQYEYTLKANYKWVVKDFTKTIAELKCAQKIESPVFQVGVNNEYEFQLQLYPRGITESNKNYLSLFLLLKSGEEPRSTIYFKCCLLNSKFLKKDHEVKECVARGHKFGFKRLIRTECLNKSSGYLDHDRVVLNCDINVVLNKTDNYKMKVVDDIETLLSNGDHSDVTLEVQEKLFKVHQCVLAARSDVFSAMFRYNRNEKTEIVKITDIKPEVMEEVLRFVYSGEVLNLENNTKEMLAAAEKYNFVDLKKLCETALGKSLAIGNVVELLKFAETHNANSLMEQALNFFVCNQKDIVNSQLFQAMANKESQLLKQIIIKMASQKTDLK